MHETPVALAWLGHSTVVLDIDGVRLVADPLLRPNNGPLRRKHDQPIRTAWDGADAMLISHLHHDHAELSSMRMLPGIPVLTADANAAWMRRKGIDTAVGLADDWYSVKDTEGRGQVDVCLTKAVHHSRPMPHRPNAANGHLVRGQSATVWLAGDTSLYDEIADLPELAGTPIDIAAVPIGGWGPRLSEGHMDGVQAAEACRMTGARYALAVHWGSLHPPFMGRDWMLRPMVEFAEALGRIAPECKLIDLRPGDQWELPGV